MFLFKQSTGEFFSNNSLLTKGYSGHGPGKNNHALQMIKSVGPCPVGIFDIGEAYDDPKHGPIAFRLTPDPHNEMFNRDGLLIHPDSIEHPGEASEGCICLDKVTRLMIKASTDKKLVVIP